MGAMQQLQNVEQQLLAASDTELRSAKTEYENAMQRQACVLTKIDITGLVCKMRESARSLDKGEEETVALVEGGGLSEEGLSQREVTSLLSRFKAKRFAFHRADIQATAAEHLQRR
jgi:hypothetical protein